MRRAWLIFPFVLSSVKEQGDICQRLESVKICLGFALHSELRSRLPSWHSHTLVSGLLLTSLFCAVISSHGEPQSQLTAAFLLHDNWVCSFILFQFEGIAVLRGLLFYSEKQWSQPHLLLLKAEFAAVYGWEACWGLGRLTNQEQTRTGQGEPTRFQPWPLPPRPGASSYTTVSQKAYNPAC